MKYSWCLFLLICHYHHPEQFDDVYELLIKAQCVEHISKFIYKEGGTGEISIFSHCIKLGSEFMYKQLIQMRLFACLQGVGAFTCVISLFILGSIYIYSDLNHEIIEALKRQDTSPKIQSKYKSSQLWDQVHGHRGTRLWDQAHRLFPVTTAAPLQHRACASSPYSGWRCSRCGVSSSVIRCVQLTHFCISRELETSPSVIFSLSVSWAVDDKGGECWWLISSFQCVSVSCRAPAEMTAPSTVLAG